MTQEEKARAYDKAIEKIKYVMEHGVSPTLSKEDLQDLFHELQESDDERIKKEIVRYINLHKNDERKRDEWIAWLEKQGDKKSSDEVLKIRQEVYQSGYNDGYKHGIEDSKQGEQKK